tara:strand:+ start:21200 stop:22024 length:825 start_codon:yes stop_codon:yes gene_type:complete
MSQFDNKLRISKTLQRVNNIIGIFSAKGGVGKSAVSLQLALTLKDQGFKVGLIDADIYGPSQSIMLNSKPVEIKSIKDKQLIKPLIKENIKFISMGLLSSETAPLIARGPKVSGAIMQLLSKTEWGELDYLIVDTPPGTGDAQLTLLQRIPLTTCLVLTTPQDVSISDCRRGIEMIKKFNLPITGIIENMSWFQPDDQNKKYYLFGKDGGKELARECSLDLLAQLPLVELNTKTILNHPLLKSEFVKISSKLIESAKSIKKERLTKIPQVTIIK